MHNNNNMNTKTSSQQQPQQQSIKLQKKPLPKNPNYFSSFLSDGEKVVPDECDIIDQSQHHKQQQRPL